VLVDADHADQARQLLSGLTGQPGRHTSGS
jgi:hypothetical protein